MSDDFTRRLEEAAAHHGREAMAGAELSLVAASVIGKARRRRRVTAALTATGAFLGVALMGGGALAIANGWGNTDPGPGNALGAPVVEMSQSPEPTAGVPTDATASPVPSTGIEEYPPLAPSRGDGFPEAYQMADWVWGYVDEGWSVQSYSAAQNPYAAAQEDLPSAVLYLASPDGALFEVLELADAYSSGVSVVSWDEQLGLARIAWAGDVNTGSSSGGAEVNLNTGDVTPLAFTTPWGISSTVAPVAVSASGNELWKAWLGGHVRYYRYGTSDGWTVASVNDLEGIGDRGAERRWDAAVGGGGSPFANAMVVRDDGAAVLFEYRVSRDAEGDAPPTEVALYDLDADEYRSQPVSLDVKSSSVAVCAVVSWAGADAIGYRCGGGSSVQTVTLDDAPPLGTMPTVTQTPLAGAPSVGRSGYVGFNEPTPRFAISPYCGC